MQRCTPFLDISNIFQIWKWWKQKWIQLSDSTDLIKDIRKDDVMFSRKTRFIIDNVLLSIKSRKNLQSFKDIHRSRYHIEIVNDNGIKYLHIVSNVFAKKQILEKLHVLSSGLYYTSISTIEMY